MKAFAWAVIFVFTILSQVSIFASNDTVGNLKFQKENDVLNCGSNRVILDPERLEFADGKIIFHTPTGAAYLNTIGYDGVNYFCEYNEALWGVFLCRNCKYTTTERITKCPRCGNTDIEVLDNWPES